MKRAYFLEALAAAGLLFGGYIFHLSFAPTSFWIEYNRVELIPPAEAGGPIDFASYAEIKRSVRIVWTDTLYCDLKDGKGLRNYSSQVTGAVVQPRPLQRSAWTYTGAVPSAGARCVVKSVASLKLHALVSRDLPATITQEFTIE